MGQFGHSLSRVIAYKDGPASIAYLREGKFVQITDITYLYLRLLSNKNTDTNSNNHTISNVEINLI